MQFRKEVFWKNPGYRPRKPLVGDVSCKYLIVGGGVTGVTLAYLLSKRNKNVVLIEKNLVGSGATGRAAGLLTPDVELDLKDAIRILGRKKGLLFWKNVTEGFKAIEKIIKKERIKCGFERIDTIYASYGKSDFNDIEEEYAETRKAHQKFSLLNKRQIGKFLKTDVFEEGLLGRGASIGPLQYVQNLSAKLPRVHEKTPLISLRGNTAVTPRGTILFDKIIMATDTFSKERGVIPILSTIAVTQKLTRLQRRQMGLKRRFALWDTDEDYGYIKTMKDGRLLVGKGHKKNFSLRNDLDRKQLKEIQRFLEKIFPLLKIRIDYAWSGNLGVTRNFIPRVIFKKNIIRLLAPGGLPVATAIAKYAANGLTKKI